MAKGKKVRLVIYRDTAGKWRWRLQAKNGRIIADGAEGYSKAGNVERAAIRFLELAAGVKEWEIVLP